MKTLKVEKFYIFCHFRCQIEIFCKEKTAIISSEKPTGQRVFGLLNVFNILMARPPSKI